MTDNSETKTVSVDTDNLNDFEELFSGKANLAEDVEDKEPVEVEDTIEDDALATEDNIEDEEEEAEEPKPKSKKKSAQERINELTRERRDAERRGADLLRRLEALETKDKPEQKTVTAAAPTPDDVDDKGEPKYPLGEFDPGFARDNVKFILAEERKQMAEQDAVKQQQTAQQAEFERISNEWATKIDKIEDRIPDFHESGPVLLETFKNIDPAHGDLLASTIMSLEYGPDVLHYLSENLDVAEKIVKMNPTMAIVQLGRIETQFIPKEQKKPKVSNAPEPPPAATRGTGTKTEVPVDTDDLDAFSNMFFKKR